MNLRQLARGKPCQVRLFGCDGGGETTVLAHYRLSGYSGMGLKSPDIMGAWCCFSCHQIVDGQKKYDGERMAVRLAHAEGCLKTIVELQKLKAERL